jgi:phosphohistidine phosphatase
MHLVVVRHAVAVAKSAKIADAARPLTKKGRKRFEKAVKGLKRLDLEIERLYHSPKKRAVETADLLSPLLAEDAETVVTDALAGPPMPDLLEELRGEEVAVVGHQPYLGALVSWLVAGTRHRGPKFDLEKGGVVVLEGRPRPGGMRLVASYPPRALRKLA